jgi:hypothetical protein
MIIVYRIFSEYVKGGNYLEDLGVEGRIILESVLEKFNGMCAVCNWLRIGTSDGLF